MNRRRWLLGGVGTAAAGLGATWSWYRQHRAPQKEASDDQLSSTDIMERLWQASFGRPEGGELRLTEFRGKPLLINFWATWCPPCVKEIPDLDRFHQTFAPQGWQVVGLAVDGPTPVREFLQKVPVHYPIGLAGLEGTELGRTLGNAQGGLPFSVVIGRAGKPLWRKLGASDYDELAARAIEWAR